METFFIPLIALSIGVLVSKWGVYGEGDGQFNWPFRVAVASDGNIYVSDANNHRIQRFLSGS